ncbi:hypothetical protein Tco_1151955 [Tanacetum coccineum]
MDNPNITMEEYIRLEEEKAHRRGQVYNWESATYGKIGYDKHIHDLIFVETEFSSIVFNDALTSKEMLTYVEWYEAPKDCKLKEEALKNKAIMEELIEDERCESSYERRRRWDIYDDSNHDYEYEMDHEERCDLFDDQERPVSIRRVPVDGYGVLISCTDLAEKKSTMLVEYFLEI